MSAELTNVGAEAISSTVHVTVKDFDGIGDQRQGSWESQE